MIGPTRMAKGVGNALRFVVGLIVAAIMMFPIYTALMGGFKAQGQIFSNPFGLPVPFSLEAYANILVETTNFWQLFLNSVLVVALVLAIVICFSMSAAFAIARIKFRGNKLLFNFFIMGLLFPLTVAILPLYLQLRGLGLTGTRLGVVLAEAAFGFPLSIFIFVGFFRDIPRDLQDACEIDGGTLFTFFVKVIIPLSLPAISTVAILNFIASWNQFLLPLLVLDSDTKFTIPLGVMQFQGQYTTGWNFIMAFITLSMLPIGIFYYSAQRYVVKGLTAGAIKG
jgi:raffinose/stachyose/melibiose transport system permease protein